MHSDYLSFFGLNDHPFRLTPDTRYFFPSSKHKAVLEVMKYGIQRGEGFIVVTGDPGSGKTMLLRVLLKELDPAFETALIIAPTLEPRELLQAILEDIGVDFNPSDTKERLVKKFRDYLIDLKEIPRLPDRSGKQREKTAPGHRRSSKPSSFKHRRDKTSIES